MPRLQRIRAVIVALVALMSSVAPAAASTEVATCEQVRVPVTVAAGSGDVAGTLCGPRDARALQVLVHGFTYERFYWDLPYRPETYSYTRRATAAGLATLAIDRIGTGDSFRPLSAALTYDNHAAAVHQVVQAARRGDLRRSFSRVVLVGHSLGSAIAVLAAGRYRDVDALVVTGASHRVDLVRLGSDITLSTAPAFLDPKFRASGLDPGYVTTRPGTRRVFYEIANADPAVIALDERLKGTGSNLEFFTAGSYVLAVESRAIDVPVLTVAGARDPFFCAERISDCSSSAALARQEAPFYGPGAASEALVVPGSGHDVGLERTAPRVHEKIIDFVLRRVGR